MELIQERILKVFESCCTPIPEHASVNPCRRNNIEPELYDGDTSRHEHFRTLTTQSPEPKSCVQKLPVSKNEVSNDFRGHNWTLNASKGPCKFTESSTEIRRNASLPRGNSRCLEFHRTNAFAHGVSRSPSLPVAASQVSSNLQRSKSHDNIQEPRSDDHNLHLHAIAFETDGTLLPVPLPGWTIDQQAALAAALKEIDHNTPDDAPTDEEAAWKRMRAASRMVPGGKTARECMACARYLAVKRVGYFGPRPLS
jgi:hypothetical protein